MDNKKKEIYEREMRKFSRKLKSILFGENTLPSKDMSSIITKNDRIIDKYLLKIKADFETKFKEMSPEQRKRLNEDYLEASRTYAMLLYGKGNILLVEDSPKYMDDA